MTWGLHSEAPNFNTRGICANKQEVEPKLKANKTIYYRFDKNYIDGTTTKINRCCNNGLHDDNENCPGWADVGECTKNPNYMLVYCKKSCCFNVELEPEVVVDVVHIREDGVVPSFG